MKYKLFIALISLGLLFSACSPAAPATSAVIPTVIADSTIIAEGRVEPVRYAEVSFITSGLVSEVLAEEGQPVKQGDLLIRVGSESDSN